MNKSAIVFAMRYPDDVGYVWKTISKVRDEIARHLENDFVCLLAHPHLTADPVYTPRFLRKVALDCYSVESDLRQTLQRFIRDHNVRAIVYMSADPAEIRVHQIHRWGVRTINTENNSFDENRQDPWPLAAAKTLMRTVLQWRLHHHYIPNSNSKREWLLRYAKLPAQRVTAVPNGVDVHVPMPEYPAHPIKRGRWVIAVGQSRAVKRIDIFIRAAHTLSQEPRFQDVEFLYIGDGEMLATWRVLAEELGLLARFHFMGAQADPSPWLHLADVFVHCAELESFGLAIAEAMRAALPVVAYRATGPAEIVLPGATGELITTLLPGRFAAGVARYLDDGDLARAHGAAGRQRIVDSFSIERQGKDMARVVRQVLAQD